MRLTESVRPWLGALVFLSLVAGLAACGDGGGGDDGGDEVRIVFYSNRDGDDDIYIMRTDGSDVRQLTDEPGRDYEPDSSPDGRTLVFASYRDGGESSQLYLMDVKGSNVRRLTFSADALAEGERVVDDYPHWSPDGQRVVFQRTLLPAEGRADADVWLIDVETGEETQLTDTPGAWDSTPSFSADGESVLFESNRAGTFDIHRLTLADGEVVQLTSAEGTDAAAKESPDGTTVAFTSDREGVGYDIWLMDADGGNPRKLTDAEGADHCPQWSPDGDKLSFFSERDGNREIYVMNVDGSEQTRLTDDPGQDEVPDWVPASAD